MKVFITLAVLLGTLYCAQAQAITSCFNAGILSNGACTCPSGFQGPQCQYATNPCAVKDPSSCSAVNCYTSTTAAFFGCQAKCLCCQNKQCGNGGRVVGAAGGACTCSCFTIGGAASKYDAGNSCNTVLSGQCTDDSHCATQFNTLPGNTANCQFDFVKYACPLTCGVCTA